MEKIYKQAVGLAIRADCGTDITLATATTLKVKKPDGTEDVWAATIVDSNYLEYETIADDLDQSGVYRIQSHLTLSGWTGSGETFELMVFDDYE